MTVTLFTSLFDKSPKYYDAYVILETFKNKNKSTHLIEQIRTTSDKEARDELKKNLPVVLFGGEFSARLDSALKKYSRLIVLDFDDCNVRTKREELILLPYIYSVWLSPSGDGLKALVKVATDNHRGHFAALKKEVEGVDGSGVNESRACFVSYDPNLYLNETSEIYTKVVEQATTDEQKLAKLKKWLENKGEAFVEGSRNNFIHTLSSACNRFGLSRKFVEETFVRDYCGSDFREREALQAIGSAYSRTEFFGTASFNDSFSQDEIKSILTVEVDTPDIIRAEDIREDLVKSFDEGVKPGETTYFPTLDNHFRWSRGEITVLTGLPNSGKSFMIQQLMLFKSVFDKVKWGVLSLEAWPPEFFYRELIRALIGKPLEKTSPYRMTKEEYLRGLDFVNEYFFFIYPKKDEPSPEWTLARFIEAQIKHGLGGVSIDPHGAQEHDKRKAGGRDDTYIRAMLNRYKRYSLTNNVYFIDVAHTKNINKNEDDTFKEPGADDVNGGIQWWAGTDNMLVYHRPGMPIIQSDACTLRSVKIKRQQQNGKPGLANFRYKIEDGRYYDEDGYSPLIDFQL